MSITRNTITLKYYCDLSGREIFITLKLNFSK